MSGARPEVALALGLLRARVAAVVSVVCGGCGNTGRQGRYPADRLLPTAAMRLQALAVVPADDRRVLLAAFECCRCAQVLLEPLDERRYLLPRPGLTRVDPPTEEELEWFTAHEVPVAGPDLLQLGRLWDRRWEQAVVALDPRPSDVRFHEALQQVVGRGHMTIARMSSWFGDPEPGDPLLDVAVVTTIFGADGEWWDLLPPAPEGATWEHEFGLLDLVERAFPAVPAELEPAVEEMRRRVTDTLTQRGHGRLAALRE